MYKHHKRNLISTLFILALAFSFSVFPSVKADAMNANTEPQITIEQLEDGYYFETTIETDDDTYSGYGTRATNTITKTKTTKYKNAAGTVLWSVSIRATFTYNGTTSRCTSCSHYTNVYSENWEIESCTSSKSGNSATATAIAVRSNLATQRVTKSVTIRCSATGTVS